MCILSQILKGSSTFALPKVQESYLGEEEGLKNAEITEELEALRLKYAKLSRGLGNLEALTCWQVFVAVAFAIISSISHYYLFISAMFSTTSGICPSGMDWHLSALHYDALS